MANDEAEQAEDYALEKVATGSSLGGRLRQPPVRKILEIQIAEFEKQIAVRKDLLAKLDKNLGVEEVLDALRKVGI